jgi:hypothetical protein
MRDFLTEAQSVASRLDLANSDLQSRRVAEQDMRALGFCFMGRTLRAGVALLRQRFVNATRPASIERKPVSLHEWLV